MNLGFLGTATEVDTPPDGLPVHTHAASRQKNSDLEPSAYKTENNCTQCDLYSGTRGQKKYSPHFHFRRHGRHHAHPYQRSLPWYISSHLNPAFERQLKLFAHPVAGPYSQAICTPHAIYVSGQLPALADGTLPPGTMAYKASLCIKNIHEILKEAGSDLNKVVKMTVFLTDMKNFAEVNREYELHFRDTKPARSCVAVKELPKGVEIEMECVALP